MTTHHNDDSFIHSVEKGGNGLGKVAVASSKRTIGTALRTFTTTKKEKSQTRQRLKYQNTTIPLYSTTTPSHLSWKIGMGMDKRRERNTMDKWYTIAWNRLNLYLKSSSYDNMEYRDRHDLSVSVPLLFLISMMLQYLLGNIY